MKYEYNFTINNKKLSFYSQLYTINHENQYCLSYNGYPLMEVDKTEVEKAIQSITETNCYNDINILDEMEKADKKEEEKNRKNSEFWDRIHNICIENENRLKAKTEEVKQYFNDVLSKQYSTGCVVYNKLDECIKQGYFVIYTGFSNWKTIKLEDTPIKQLELLEVK